MVESNRSTLRCWFSYLIFYLLLAGCSAPTVSAQEVSLDNEDAFWQTTYCVAGGLPMEVRFSLHNNPSRFQGDSLDVGDIDRLSKQVDVKIAALLKDSVIAAWKALQDEGVSELSDGWTPQLAEELVVQIVARASGALGLSFCGTNEQVGSAAYASIYGYFSRAVQLDGGRAPSWLSTEQAKSNGGMIVMLAVALRLAEIEFSANEIVRTLAKRSN